MRPADTAARTRPWLKTRQGVVHTATHCASLQTITSCGIVNSMALLPDPQAGNTVVNRCSDSSRYIRTPSLTPNGHTPPTACPMSSSTESLGIIRGFTPNRCLKAAFDTFASPAVTTIKGMPSTRNDRVLAIRSAWVPKAAAASVTVALELSNSRTWPSNPNRARCVRARSIAIVSSRVASSLPSRTLVILPSFRSLRCLVQALAAAAREGEYVRQDRVVVTGEARKPAAKAKGMVLWI